MIKVSFISPTSLISEYGSQGDFHLALAHLLPGLNEEPNDYERALVESGLPIYLDNGLFENKVSVPIRDLIHKALRLKAKYVFAPDVLYDRKATEANIDEAWETLEELKEDYPESEHTELAAVVQASNPDDFRASYMTFAADARIQLIGLSILSVPYSYKDLIGTDDITKTRIECLKQLIELPRHKKSHLLGLGSSYADVAFANNHCSWVDSHDSSSAIWNAIQGKKIDPHTLEVEGGKTKVHVDFNFNESLDEETKNTIQHNINVVKSITK